MPFTFSHPAIVLPLTKYRRHWFSITALIAGSMAPDFFFFLQLKFSGKHGSSLPGIAVRDILMGLAICFIFHLFVRNELVNNLPKYFQSRLKNSIEYDFVNYFKKNFFVVITSLLVGIFSHYLWDSFTHGHGFFVEHISFFQRSIQINGYNLTLYQSLQIICTFVGLFFIIYLAARLPIQTKVTSKVDPLYWILVISITILFMGIIFGTEFRQITSGNLILVSIASGLGSLVIAPLFLKIRRCFYRT